MAHTFDEACEIYFTVSLISQFCGVLKVEQTLTHRPFLAR